MAKFNPPRKLQTFRSLFLILLCGVTIGTLSFAPSTSRAEGSDKMVNIRVAPVGLIVGWINVDADIKLSDQWTLGPTFTYWHFRLDSTDPYFPEKLTLTYSAIGARANWHMNGTFSDGFYLSPLLRYETASVSTDVGGVPVSASVSAFSVTGMVGYHWFWDSFNLSLGGGLNVRLGSEHIRLQAGDHTQDLDYGTSSAVGPAADFMLGWTF